MIERDPKRLELAWSAVLEAALRGLQEYDYRVSRMSVVQRELTRIRDIAIAVGAEDVGRPGKQRPCAS